MKAMRIWILSILWLVMSGCAGLPEGISPVDDFDVGRYMGTWYEIARLDHSFERNKHKVTAEYSLRDDGGVKVVNKAYSVTENEWSEAEGKAYFVEDKDRGYLKVSFFGPFYGTYVVFELDKENYQYSYVSGPDKSYLWLLARTPEVSEEVINRFVETSRGLGFNTDELIFTEQDSHETK
jgi:apolipoprotein D and lipocalin family protein